MAQLPIRVTSKLMIIPYLSSKDGKLSGIAGKPFVAMYNPTTFTMSAGKEMKTKVVAGGGPGILEDLYTDSRTLTVDLIIDGTGASPPLGIPIGAAFGAVGNLLPSGGSVTSINAQAVAQAAVSSVAVTKYINYFFNITAAGGVPKSKFESGEDGIYNPETHQSNYLKVIWGKGLKFRCKLSNATVKYNLFNQLGQPLRATISATFTEEGIKVRSNSPDLTKVYLVKAGDTIYNLAKQEYDDESYYIKIAEANDLKNYRRLVPGQELILPPIAKTEEA